ncbi:M48 family metalloprotease [Colwellia sp. BRX10-3]|uniref:M48 family metalloprotease n=1 Tax=Colwellia sp. BRX10-3 TaxID=2759844 RepID=UPI002174DF7B|nr:M48 family metalloprotease [Colwellia sp. BRX10-3]
MLPHHNSNSQSTGALFVLEMLLGVFASTIFAWFSRKREFRADIGGAQLAGTAAMQVIQLIELAQLTSNQENNKSK